MKTRKGSSPREGSNPREGSKSRGGSLRKGLAALLALVVLALVLQPWWLAPLAGHLLSSSARRSVHFDSVRVTLSGALAPVIHFRGIRIDNAPWADARGPFARLDEATAVFSWQSVREHRPVIALLILRNGEVDLERRADGLRNWRLSHPDDRGPGRYKVLSIRGENASVRFLHERIGLDFEATARPGRDDAANGTGAEPMPTRLDVRGAWRGVPFVIDAATGEVLTFAETGRTFRVRGSIVSAGARLDVDGHLGDIVRDPLVDARVALVAPSLAPFAAVLGGRGSAATAIVAEGEAKGAPGRYSLALRKARLGATDLAGTLSWSRADERDTVRATLTSESARVADLRSLAGRQPARTIERAAAASAAPSAAAAAASAEAAASSPAHAEAAASSPARARPVDIELSFAARRLHGEDMPWLQSAALDASLADGRLAVSRFDIGIGRGHAVGKASVDTTSRPPRGELEADLSALRIESMLPAAAAAKSLLSGTLHGRALLKASGESAEALLASATGTVSAFVSGGTISSRLDAEMGLQGGRIVRSMLAGAEPVAIRCAAAVLDLGRGIGRLRTLVIDSERTRTTGSGTVDLANGSLDIVLTPEAKQPGLFILDRSIRLHGALRQPEHALIARAAPASAPARGCSAERP